MFGFVALAAMGAVFLISFAPETLWLLFLFGWLLLPALGAATATLMRGAASLPKRRRATAPGRTAASGERELLRALQEHGELSPARAAMESESLSVAEADRILRRLTEAGYLEVRVRGGGLFYALWEADSRPQEALGDTGPEGSGR